MESPSPPSVARHPFAGRRLHMYGVAGAGMAPLAVTAQQLGAEVSGCDRGGRPDVHEYLARAGIRSDGGHSVEHVQPGTTVVATGIAAPEDPEIVAADAAGVRWHRMDLLATILRTRRSLGVTGSHGKGTVTALAASALTEADADPFALLGLTVGDFGGMTRVGDGPFVAEVDNSDLSLARVDTDVAVVTTSTSTTLRTASAPAVRGRRR